MSNWGETFLNPELKKIVEYAFNKGVSLTCDNGVNLNDVDVDVLESLVKYRFKSMVVSIDGVSDASYSSIRMGGDFKKVISNIKKINELKERYSSRFPIMTWQFIPYDQNVGELHSARLMAKELDMNFYIKFSVEESLSSKVDCQELNNEVSGGISSRRDYFNKHGIIHRQKLICSQLWQSPQVNWDGRLLGCCINYWGDFGDVFKDGLIPSINGDKINYARKMLIGKAKPKADNPCSYCVYYKIMKDSGNWITKRDLAVFKSWSWIKDFWMTHFGRIPLPKGFWV